MEMYGRRNTGPEGFRRRTGRVERDAGVYPERPGMADCTFYMKTGRCAYGEKCRFNHPRNRVGGNFRYGDPPQRPGEPPCQFYLRTGNCKFGGSCKFHHPKIGEGYTVKVNSNGYPLRLGVPECSYYLKTGRCNFGLLCKFNHPQMNGMSTQASSPLPFYPSAQNSPVPSPGQYMGSAVSYRAGRPPPLLPGSYVPHGPYGPVLVPPGVVPIPSWSTYSGPVSPAMSPNTQPTGAAGSPYGVPRLPSSTPGFVGPYHTFSPSSLGPSSSSQKVNEFPERPGQADCYFYLKTGDCKFRSACKFNHPPDLGGSMLDCAISSLGLPLRPGMQPCSFYMRNGSCKFGRLCKFDHPMGPLRYSPSASSLTDVPVAPYMVGSPLATLAPSFSYTELLPEFIPGSKPESYLNQGPSAANTFTSSTGLIFQQNGPTFPSNIQLSSQTPMPVSISTRPGGEVQQSRT